MASNNNLSIPPIAQKIAKSTESHGKTLQDNYFWLRAFSSETSYTTEFIRKLDASIKWFDAARRRWLTVTSQGGVHSPIATSPAGHSLSVICRTRRGQWLFLFARLGPDLSLLDWLGLCHCAKVA